MKLSNNSSSVILIFKILKFRNVDRSTFRRSKFRPPPISKMSRTFILHDKNTEKLFTNR